MNYPQLAVICSRDLLGGNIEKYRHCFSCTFFSGVPKRSDPADVNEVICLIREIDTG